MPLIRTYSLYFAWLVALAALVGSLWFSEVAGFIPCKLCWFQRILMYPLAVVLGIASYRSDRSIVLYALPFSLIGIGVSLFHYAQQKIPGWADVAGCSQGVPCSGQYINWFGFITIPFLALIAFILISVFLWVGRNESA
ncbi:MAG: disulfide oxidoreductase [Firmicutes bacterium]|uniref:Disulfide bond formation protein DsbB n=1 Tax=Melghirimyces thermohalophilus TaxID=1236220 RepID=A0A1G6QLT8_9BACL|nr:disulfide oxidoreductase [Melghirimyces thermohalophilus]MDA8354210.1 disulfide oxidoreductase [Bacillota bacterium]SDC92615.1 disulfide bond formation protein DsbB [Melghirimyces thermohalophilus]